MADKTLEILIKVVADTLGIQITREQAQALTAELGKQGAATQATGEDSAKAAEKLKLFHGEAGEMRKVITEVTRISPMLGEALRIAMNPVGGTVAAAVGLFVLMKEHISEVNRELDDMGVKAAEPTFLEGIRARLDVLREASKAAAEYSTHINTLLTGEQGITSELASQLSLQAAITAARQEQTKAELTLEQAKIRAAQARGEISPEVAAARMASANAKAIADEARAKSNAQYGDVSTKTTALETAEGQMPQLKANADALTKTYSDEAARRANNAKDFGGDDVAKQITETQKAGEEARKALANQYSESAADQIIAGNVPGASAWATMQAGIVNSSAAKVKSLQAGRAQFQADQVTEGQFNELGTQAADARQKADTNAQTIGALTGELKRLTDTILATRGPESATTSARIAASNMEYAGELAGQNSKVVARERQAFASGNPAEIQKAVDEAHAHGRGLIAASNAARESNKEVFNATVDALTQFRREQSSLAQQIHAATRFHR
jgi:hypothetical protein